MFWICGGVLSKNLPTSFEYFPYTSHEAFGILRVKFKYTIAPRDFVTIGVLQIIFYLSTITIQGFLVKHQLLQIRFNFC